MDVIRNVIAYYLPLWMPLVFVVVPQMLTSAAELDQFFQPRKWAIQLLLGQLSFWAWAITTNAHSGTLVKSGGTRTGKLTDRQNEFPTLLFFGILTLIMFAMGHSRLFSPYPKSIFALAWFSQTLPLFAMGLPPCLSQKTNEPNPLNPPTTIAQENTNGPSS